MVLWGYQSKAAAAACSLVSNKAIVLSVTSSSRLVHHHLRGAPGETLVCLIEYSTINYHTTADVHGLVLLCFASFSTLIMSQRGSQKFPSRVSLHGLENEDQNPTHRYGRWLINVRSKVARLTATGLPSLMRRDRPSFPMGALSLMRVCAM